MWIYSLGLSENEMMLNKTYFKINRKLSKKGWICLYVRYDMVVKTYSRAYAGGMDRRLKETVTYFFVFITTCEIFIMVQTSPEVTVKFIDQSDRCSKTLEKTTSYIQHFRFILLFTFLSPFIWTIKTASHLQPIGVFLGKHAYLASLSLFLSFCSFDIKSRWWYSLPIRPWVSPNIFLTSFRPSRADASGACLSVNLSHYNLFLARRRADFSIIVCD